MVLLVPHQGRLGGPDHRTSQRVALAQVGHLVSAPNPGHGAGKDTQLGTEPVLAAAVFLPGGNDLSKSAGPSPFDRVQANGLTAHCIEYLAEQLESGGRASAMIGFQSGRLQFTDLTSYPQLI